ncbi:Nucleolar protein 9 [Oopsacas minuta]|uniref:Nucleolar protein 9 n=1 Tax=Oopsacas minuta TaxID=111878 RepID=A0AAV7JT18_9METZ|nr:Nucleolar protein 9 [Oopsacas minuta]
MQSVAKKLPNLSETSAAYYERMSYVLSYPENVELTNREDLVQNFIQQVTSDNLVTVSLNMNASKVLESFITGWCMQDNMLTLLTDINRENIQLLAIHKNGSHVLQSILTKISKFIYKMPALELSNLLEFFGTEFAPCCIEHCIELAFDSYGTYILRVLLQIVCGVLQSSVNDKDYTGAVRKPEYQLLTAPREFSHLPEMILKQFKDYPHIVETVTDTYASPAIICLVEIFSLSHSELSRKLNQYLIKCISPFDQLIDHEKGSYLIQSLISTANERQYARLFTQFPKGSIYKYATCNHANYAIQTLIANIHTEEHFNYILQELSSKQIEAILGVGNFGVLHQIIKSGIEYPGQQKLIKSILLETFQCQDNPISLIPLLLLMSPLNNVLDSMVEERIIFKQEDNFHLHGSLIAQNLFSFEKTKSFAKSLLYSSIDGILKIASDPNGCHVLDKFVSSEKVKGKYKNKLYVMLEERFVDFVCCKYGSRVFDCIWIELDYEWKERFMIDISQKESILKSDFYGKFVLRNCKLDLYKRKRIEWRDSVQDTMKHRFEEQNPSAKRGKSESEHYSKKRKVNNNTNKITDIDVLFNKLN